MTIAFDTTVVVAALCSWHEHHGAAHAALDSALAGGVLVIPDHALGESWSVLTRLPPPHRLPPDVAWRLLEANLGECPVGCLPPGKTWELLERLRDARIVGGAAWDVRVCEEALAGGATGIVTLNVRHFVRVAPPGLAVRAP